jgi:tRNA-dihydrouridine synthase A
MATTPVKSREQVLEAMIPYIARSSNATARWACAEQHHPPHARPDGRPAGRARFRQLLSDSRRLAEGNPELLLEAAGRMRKAA